MVSVPMVLNIADVLWQGGANNPLSAVEILPCILPGNDDDVENLQWLLRMLASYDVFYEHLSAKAIPILYFLLIALVSLGRQACLINFLKVYLITLQPVLYISLRISASMIFL